MRTEALAAAAAASMASFEALKNDQRLDEDLSRPQRDRLARKTLKVADLVTDLEGLIHVASKPITPAQQARLTKAMDRLELQIERTRRAANKAIYQAKRAGFYEATEQGDDE